MSCRLRRREPEAAQTDHPRLSAAALSSTLRRVSARSGTACRIPAPDFYLSKTEEVAERLLGAFLLHVEEGLDRDAPRVCGGRIVEVEAYLGERDPACHAAHGRTARTEIFYRAGGVAYVFRSYGIHHCFNVIALPRGQAGCVLVRALEPLFDIPRMAERRGVDASELSRLCSGPGKLCQALDLSVAQNGYCVRTSPVLILVGSQSPPPVARGPRVGITKAADWPLRFHVKGSPWVSRISRALKRRNSDGE